MSLAKNIFDSLDTQEVRSAVNKKGYYLPEMRLSSAFCEEAINFIDSFSANSQTEINYGGSECRVWDCQSKSPLLKDFFDDCCNWISTFSSGKNMPKTLLGIRNAALPEKAEQLTRGRWHIDSFRNQIKIFLFLTDTTEESGPFEFIPGSHQNFFKLRMICRGAYFKPSDFFNKQGRAYQRIDDKIISRLSKKGFNSKPVIVKQGTMLIVDTSSIHRARPCLKGNRYALTAYYS